MTRSPLTQKVDREIAELLALGDEEALRLLIKEYGPSIRNVLTRRFQGALGVHDVDDVLFEAILRVWNHRHRYNYRAGSLAAWVAAIGLNVARDRLRKDARHRHEALLTDLQMEPVASNRHAGQDANGQEQRSEVLECLRAVIGQLPPLQRAIVEADLAAGGVADGQELASQLGTSTNAVYVHRSRARNKIRSEMRKRGHFLGAT